MEETRASMTEKLELLEEKVRETLVETKSAVEDIVENVKGTVDETVDAVKETVDGAKSTVEDIVENVKGTMDDTVTTVKQTFDLSYQVNQHPWVLFGGAVLLGGFLGNLLQRQPQTNGYRYDKGTDKDESYGAAFASQAKDFAQKAANNFAVPQPSPSAQTAQQGNGWWSGLGQFQDEFNMVKGAVISTIMGTVREMIRQNMPSVAPKLEKAIDSASQKLGAAPIEPSADPQHTNGNERQEQKSQSPTSPSRESLGQQRQ
jgi:ElaB/YqjD/DUF883 family membrane-anchored ribosome-binding protein